MAKKRLTQDKLQPKSGQLSIVVPTYNESPALLHDLRALQYLDGVLDIVLVDASDQEKLKQAVNNIPQTDKFKVVHAQQKGRAGQMNVGADEAQGSLLLFLHADTQVPSNLALTVQRALGAGYQWGRFNTKLSAPNWPFKMIAWFMNKRSAWTQVATGDQALFMTRAAFNQVGGFDDIPLMEDVALCKKLRKIGAMADVPETVVTSARRWQKQGIRRTIVLMWWLRLRYFLGGSTTKLANSYQTKSKKERRLKGRPSFKLFLFAKAPVAGKVKSRLSPPLDMQQAAIVAEQLLGNACINLDRYWPGQVVLAVSPDIKHRAFRALQRRYDFDCVEQYGTDLGERMANALDDGLQTGEMAAVIGADIPAINRPILEHAYEWMAQGEGVIGPTMDGGFYFLGVAGKPTDLFLGVQWGSNKVFEQIMQNANDLHIKLNLLPKLHDCDYWPDVQHAASEIASFRRALQAHKIDLSFELETKPSSS